jgi:hypothetical protein
MLKSKSKMIKPMSLPEYRGDRLYMHAFDISNPQLPAGYERWNPYLMEMISHSPKKTGKAYLTIDEKLVTKGESHRRGGPHTDGNYLFGWSPETPDGGPDPGSGWLTGEDGRFLPREQHEEQYCSEKGGMLIISSYEACRGWNGEYDGQPNQGGDCSHLDLSKMEDFNLKADTLYWGNSTFIHESLPLEEDVKRQLVRVTLPADAEDLI